MKLRKIVKVGATVQYEQSYLGGLEYRKNGTGSTRVEAVYHAEGRYLNLNAEVNNTLLWQKEYTLKDHLGNARISFTDKNANGIVDVPSDIVQENHYYPFGLNYEGAWRMNDAVARDTRYQYNSKEWNDDFGLNWNDYGARWYDPAIGRWGQIDPMADKYRSYSPYNYVLNNPISNIDPDGMSVLTDYYNQNGQHVKHVEDGSNEKVMVMTTSKKADKVEEAIAEGRVGPVASSAALEKMDEAYEFTAKTGNESGFAVATTGETSTLDVTSGDAASVKLDTERSELKEAGLQVAYDVHTHPEGGKNGQYGAPTPSDGDTQGMVGYQKEFGDTQNSVVLGFTAQEVVKPGQGTIMGTKETEIQVTS